jgi:hypothetical protein
MLYYQNQKVFFYLDIKHCSLVEKCVFTELHSTKFRLLINRPFPRKEHLDSYQYVRHFYQFHDTCTA